MTYNKPAAANDAAKKTPADTKSADGSSGRKDTPAGDKPAVVTEPGKKTAEVTPPPKA